MKSLAVVSNAFFVTRDFEANRDLMTKVETKWSSTTRTRYDYAYDDRRLRQSVVQRGDVFADYGGADSGAIHQIFAYNGRGEVTAAATYLGATATDQTTPLSARKHEFDYDGIGNRKWSNTSGSGSLKDNYTVNALNQYTSRDNNTLAVGGVADTDALVAARSSGLAGRAGKHWGDNITLENTFTPFSGNLKFFAVKPGNGGAAYSRQVIERLAFLPPAVQAMTYDADGNIIADGVWTYAWDAENRLTAMETTAGALAGGMTAMRLEFKYDYMGRRVEKLVRGGWNGSAFTTVTLQRRYLYDGWSLIAEFSVSGSTLTTVRTYTWGLDIARSLKDAGGVGALIQMRDYSGGKDYFPSYDGNGNIAALLDADSSNGTVAAAYEYSPYGEFLRCEGTYAKENPFRFSTKFTDDETGLVYYGKRYYAPRDGRFLGRDTIQEAGGLNLYGFCGNNSVNSWDVLGMAWTVSPTDAGTFMASATDVNGVLREWNFENRADAERWAAAWEVENYDLLRPYIYQIADEAAARQTAFVEQWITQTIQLNIGLIGSLYNYFFPWNAPPFSDDDDDAINTLLHNVDPFTLYFTIQQRLSPPGSGIMRFWNESIVGGAAGKPNYTSLNPSDSQRVNWENALFTLRQLGPLGAAMFNCVTTNGLNVVQLPSYDLSPEGGPDFSSQGGPVSGPYVKLDLNQASLLNRNSLIFQTLGNPNFINMPNQLSLHGAVVLGHELGHALIDLHDDLNPPLGGLGNNVQAVENMLRAAIGEPRRQNYNNVAIPATVPAATAIAVDRFILKWTPKQ